MRFARILCCAALAVCAFGVRAQQVMLDKVVAVVGGSSITYSEVENTARRLTESRREQGYTSDRDPMNEALGTADDAEVAFTTRRSSTRWRS